ncbi:MAG: glutamate synthase-related protein [Desulfobacterales bacterium]|nr:glutamate synthase-related protein [Desulfobacterales bacterium]MDX2512867.1 glutamate synthase-related protein [Desulfobacterales bacterium]
MAKYRCVVCEYVYDEDKNSSLWMDIPEDYTCPVCGSAKKLHGKVEDAESPPIESAHREIDLESDKDLDDSLLRTSDDIEVTMADIHQMAETGESITEPMRTRIPTFSWNELLIKGAQLATLPLNKDEQVETKTIIGPGAAKPLIIQMPFFITHMSFGALSSEAKTALARGSAAVKTAMCSGEGGILPSSIDSAYKYIFEYVPNRYSVTEENLKRVAAIEIKFGQSAKPGMGGHLPGEKVTEEIAEIRDFPPGESITSPSKFDDIQNREDLKKKILWLREVSEGRPIGVKFAAGNIEADLKEALYAEPDFITIDGRAGATGAAPKYVKASTSVPTIFALHRARKFLDESGAKDVSLIITGGVRISADIAKALALGADAVAIGTAALMAIGCQQYRICNTGRCPMGIATQDPTLRGNLNINKAARKLENFLNVTANELRDFARLTGNQSVHTLSVTDLCTVNAEISNHTSIEHV